MNQNKLKTVLVDTVIKKHYLKKKIKINNSSWIKKWSIFYALLKVSKKKIKQNLICFKPNFFYIALLPILGYALDQKNSFAFYQGPNYSEAGGGFLNKTLPGVNNFRSINSTKLSWETFNYTNYFKKINWNTVNKINYFDGSIFISFNANSKLYNKQYYIGIYNNSCQLNNALILNSKTNNNAVLNSTNTQTLNLTDVKKKLTANNIATLSSEDQPNFKNYFLSGRYYNQLGKNYCIEPTKIKANSLKNFKTLSYWQNYLSELDHIPTKLNNIYFSPVELGSKAKTTLSQKNPIINSKLTLLNHSDIKTHPFYLDSFNQKEPETKATSLQLFNTVEKTGSDNINIDLENKQIAHSKKLNATAHISEHWDNKVKSQTSIEKQSNQLNVKLYVQNANLWNRRLFQYKIDKNIFLFRSFLNCQTNNFHNDKKDVLRSRVGVNIKNFFINEKLKNPRFFQEDDWKTALRNDVLNLGHTQIKSLKKRSSVDFKNDQTNIKNPASIRQIQKLLKQKQTASILSKFNFFNEVNTKNKKIEISLVPKFQSTVLKHINAELFLIDPLK